jgi:hypothetical protein
MEEKMQLQLNRKETIVKEKNSERVVENRKKEKVVAVDNAILNACGVIQKLVRQLRINESKASVGMNVSPFGAASSH